MKVTPLSEGHGAVVLHVDITERRQQEAQVNHLASFDQLTGAANRHHFYAQAQQVLKEAESEDAPLFSALPRPGRLQRDQ